MNRRLAPIPLALLTIHLLRVFWPPDDRADAEARLAYLAHRLDSGDFPGLAPGHPFDGEWRLMTLSWATVAATNLAFSYPETRAERAAQVGRWAKMITTRAVRDYDTREWGRDALDTLDRADGHAGYLGHVVLAMDAACLLGAPRDEALHAKLVDALARRVSQATEGLIETYPGETYVPDNVVVMASLVQFDRCVGAPRHESLRQRWLETMRARWIDVHTGVLVFAPGQPSRGSGAAWNSFYLPFVDDAFAAEQSQAMWATFGDTAVGDAFEGIREWPLGEDGVGDVDSGPLVLGVSPSATGFALGDATLRVGSSHRRGLLRTAELVGVSFGGRYLTAPLVGDAIVLAASTLRFWSPAGDVPGPRLEL